MTGGKCGENLWWILDDFGTLAIGGTGDMENYRGGNRGRVKPSPWFDLNGSIKKIIVGDSVTSIGDWAFDNCMKVAEVKLPNSVTKIGNGAFNYCQSLDKIIIPDSVTIICDGAFAGCFALTYLTISESVVDIGAWAFNACEGLKNVTIPASVIKIGEWIFAACFLKEIHYPAGRGFEKNLSDGNNAKLIPYNVTPPAITNPTVQPKFPPVQPTKPQPKS